MRSSCSLRPPPRPHAGRGGRTRWPRGALQGGKALALGKEAAHPQPRCPRASDLLENFVL